MANYVGQYNQLNGKAIATRIDSKGVEFIWNKKSAFIAEIAFEVNKCFDSFSEEERNLFLARTGEILDKYQNMKTIDRPFIQGIDNEEK
ncbi:MAG TPA: hypothetical protein VFJ43_06845 [Bacteroidia bacterium]|nr:hypothetical protein [Bacteroidia bacterium]